MDTVAQMLSCKPKNIQVADLVREQILSGKFRKGDKLLPDGQLALQYQINPRTVAAGLNALVQEGLLERGPRRGTVVKADGNVGGAVGVVMMGDGDVYGDMFRMISSQFSQRGLYPVLIDGRFRFDPDMVVKFLGSLLSERTKPYGLLIDGDMLFPFDFLRERLERLHNIVFIHSYHQPERLATAKYALVDFAAGGRLVARHLIANGHRKMACLGMHEPLYQGLWSSIQEQIVSGFADECRESGVAFSDASFRRILSGAPFDAVLGELLKDGDAPTALFCYADYRVRSEIIPQLVANGLKPMRDVELVGFYNTPHAADCGFSSLDIQEEKLAAAAVRLLVGETGEREILIEPKLVVRRPDGNDKKEHL